MKRTKLADRLLPDYTRGEEIMNMVTHIVGGGIGVVVLVLCVVKAALKGDIYGVIGSAIYGGSMVALYAMSSIYHGLRPGMGKKVLQVLDHCTIYFLIAGTYTVLALSPLREYNPWLGWGMLVFQWQSAAQTYLDNSHIDLLRGKIAECQECSKLEERGTESKGFVAVLGEKTLNLFTWNHLAVDAYALAKVGQVGRGVESHTIVALL